jgi:hypothetical protein
VEKQKDHMKPFVQIVSLNFLVNALECVDFVMNFAIPRWNIVHIVMINVNAETLNNVEIDSVINAIINILFYSCHFKLNFQYYYNHL